MSDGQYKGINDELRFVGIKLYPLFEKVILRNYWKLLQKKKNNMKINKCSFNIDKIKNITGCP